MSIDYAPHPNPERAQRELDQLIIKIKRREEKMRERKKSQLIIDLDEKKMNALKEAAWVVLKLDFDKVEWGAHESKFIVTIIAMKKLVTSAKTLATLLKHHPSSFYISSVRNTPDERQIELIERMETAYNKIMRTKPTDYQMITGREKVILKSKV